MLTTAPKLAGIAVLGAAVGWALVARSGRPVPHLRAHLAAVAGPTTTAPATATTSPPGTAPSGASSTTGPARTTTSKAPATTSTSARAITSTTAPSAPPTTASSTPTTVDAPTAIRRAFTFQPMTTPTCTYDSSTEVITVSATGGPVTISQSAGTVEANTTPCTGGTVNNTKSITVSGTVTTLDIDLTGGPLAGTAAGGAIPITYPGATAVELSGLGVAGQTTAVSATSATAVTVTEGANPATSLSTTGSPGAYQLVVSGPGTVNADLSAATVSTTFSVGTGSSSFTGASAANNSLDLTALGSGTTAYLTGSTLGTGKAVNGSVTDTFSNVGSLTGVTGDTLDLSGVTATGKATVTPDTSVSVTGPASTEAIKGFTSFVGSPAGTTFDAPAGGGYSFTGSGPASGNTLQLTGSSSVTVDVSAVPGDGTVQGLTSGRSTDAFSDIGVFDGAATDTLSFSGFAAGGTGLSIDPATTTGTATLAQGKAQVPTIDFTGFGSFMGATSGPTTFVADSAGGETLYGGGGPTTLDLSKITGAPTVDLGAGTVSGLTTNDTVSGITTVRGAAGGTTLDVGSGPVDFQGATGANNSLDLTGLGSGTTAYLTGSTLGTGKAVNGSVTDTFSNVGSLTGVTGDTLDLSGVTATGKATVTPDNTISVTGPTSTESISKFTSFVGSPNGTTFTVPSAGGYIFTGTGASSANTLTLPNAANLTVDVTTGPGNGAVAGLSSPDQFADIGHFNAAGTANTLSFAGFAAGGSGLSVDTATNTAALAQGKAQVPTIDFSGFDSFVGATSGPTTFVADSAGGETLYGAGGPTTLDLSKITGAPTVDLGAGTVSGLTTNDTVSGITTVRGAAGGTTLDVGSGPVDFQGATGANNSLDLTGLGSGTTAYLSGSTLGTGRAVNGSVTDTFSGVGTLTGVTGDTLDLSGLTATGKATVIPDNTISVTGPTSTESISKFTSFVGSPSGTAFDAPGGGGYSFTGSGAAAANSLSLSGSNLTVDVTAVPGDGTVQGLTSGRSTDAFSDMGVFDGGATDTLSFAGFAAGGTGLSVDTAAPTNNTATLAQGTTISFSGFDSFVGATSGPTTFVADSAGGESFYGGGGPAALDLSKITTALSVDLGAGTVSGSGLTSSDKVSGITKVLGAAGGTTLDVGSGPVDFQGTGANNSFDLTALGSGTTAYLTGSTLGTGKAVNGSVTDTFSGVGTLAGVTGDTLDLSGVSISGLGVTSTEVSVGATPREAISGFTSFVGSPNGTTFTLPSSGGYSFTGTGASSANTLTLPNAANLTVDVTTGPGNGSIAGLSGASPDTFAGIGVFAATGTTNTLSFSGFAAGGSGLSVNTATNTAALAQGKAQVPTIAFSGFDSFVGATSGPTTFVADSAGGETLYGGGGPTTLDLSKITGALKVDLGAGTVSGALTNDDTVSGITTVLGGSAGVSLTVGATPVDFQGAGTANSLDLSALGSGTTAYLTGSTLGTGKAVNGSVTDTFSGVGSLTGVTGDTLDMSGITATGLAVTTTQLTLGTAKETISGFDSFVGSSKGTTFDAPAGGGYSFTGTGPAGNNELSLTKTSGVTVDVSGLPGNGTVSYTASPTPTSDSFADLATINGLTGSGTDALSFAGFAASGGGVVVNTATGAVQLQGAGGVGTMSFSSFAGFSDFVGATSGPTTFVADSTGGQSFYGGGGSTTLDLSQVGPTATPTVDLATGDVKGPATDDTVSGITAVNGAPAGTTVDAGQGPVDFTGNPAGIAKNALDLTALGPGTTAYLSGDTLGTGKAVEAGVTDTFSNVGSLTGVLGDTLDLSGITASGLTVTSSKLTIGTAVTAIAGFNSFVGSVAGTTFDPPPQGGYTFTGEGPATGNTLTLPSSSNLTVDVTRSGQGTVSGLSGPADTFGDIGTAKATGSGATIGFTGLTTAGAALTVDASAGTAELQGSTVISFSGFSSFVGATSGPTTFLAGAGGGQSFYGAASGSQLNVSAISGATVTLGNAGTGLVSTDHFYGIADFVGGSGTTLGFTDVPPGAKGVGVTVTAGSSAAGQGTATLPDGTSVTFSGMSAFTGSGGNDTFLMGPQSTGSFTGGSGDATFVFLGGNDTVAGGTGSENTVDLSQVAGPTSLDLGESAKQPQGSGGSITITADIQHAIASPGQSTLTGGPGDTTLTGGSGTDTFVPGPTGSVTTIDGQAGATNTLDYSKASSSTGVMVNLSTTAYTTPGPSPQTIPAGTASGGGYGSVILTNVENVTGSPGNDVIVGDSNPNTIDGGTGNDLIVGGGGGDTLSGAPTSNDTFVIGGPGDNTVSAGAQGNSTVDFYDAPAGVNVNLGTGVVTGGWGGTQHLSNIRNVVGSTHDDILLAGTQGGVLVSEGGNDLLVGSPAGHDTLVGGSGNCTFVAGAAGFDLIEGGTGNDTIFARTPSNVITGGGGIDRAQVSPTDHASGIQEYLP